MKTLEEKIKTNKNIPFDKKHIVVETVTFDSMQNLIKENNDLKDYIKIIFKRVKNFFRELLQIVNEKTKDLTTSEIKDYYDNRNFNSDDIYDISKGTIKEDELFNYAKIPSYMKSNKHTEKEKDDFEISL